MQRNGNQKVVRIEEITCLCSHITETKSYDMPNNADQGERNNPILETPQFKGHN